MSADKFDAIIIGAGHNGLVTAGYLARAGWKVLVLERRYIVGGACVSEETFPGFKISTAAYVNSLLRTEIIRDFKLKQRGFEMLKRDPSSFSPFSGNRHLIFWADPEKTKAEIAKFSAKDAREYHRYEQHLEDVVKVIEPMLMAPPPQPDSKKWSELLSLANLGMKIRGETVNLTRLFSMSVADYLDRWFESPELKVRLATDGVIGAMAGPRTPGTAYVLFHHVMGETDGQRGVWGYVKGGMGRITQMLADFVTENNGTIMTNAEVAKVTTKQGKATGVVLADGRDFQANVVISNCDPQRTFLKMFEPLDLPEAFVNDIRNMRFRSGTVKINCTARGLPNFHAYPGTEPGPQHRGTIHFCPDMDFIERAFDDAKWGKPSEKPVVEMCIPSVVDPSIAPAGKHFVSLFVQYAPYERSDGKAWNDATEKEFAERCFAVIREYVSNWDDILMDYQVLTPKKLEDVLGLTGGNIFHGEMSLDQLLYMRPSPAYSRYSSPIAGFYLCGSGTHPGGGVMGAPGYLAAQRILKERTR